MVKSDLRIFGLVLVAVLALANAPASGQNTSAIPDAGPAASGNDSGQRLMQLVSRRPEVAGLLKGYLAQRLTAEGVEVEEKSITNQMLFNRIQSDPVFARDASQWLADLGGQTSASLQPVPPNGSTKDDAALGLTGRTEPKPAQLAVTQSPPEPVATAKSAPTLPGTSAVPSLMPTGADFPTGNAFSSPAAASSGAISKVPSTSIADVNGPTGLTVRNFPKNFLQEQAAFWTQPLHLDVHSLGFLVPATFGTAALIATDTSIEPHLPKSANTIKMAANGSTAGMLGLVGVGGGLYLVGKATHDEHKIETGYLVGEAAIDAYASSTAMQYITQRERPFTGNNKGQFFRARLQPCRNAPLKTGL